MYYDESGKSSFLFFISLIVKEIIIFLMPFNYFWLLLLLLNSLTVFDNRIHGPHGVPFYI